MSLAFKIIVALIILTTLGFSLWLNHASYNYWKYVHATPVSIMKNRSTGDLIVQTPYGDDYTFKALCSSEYAL